MGQHSTPYPKPVVFISADIPREVLSQRQNFLLRGYFTLQTLSTFFISVFFSLAKIQGDFKKALNKFTCIY